MKNLNQFNDFFTTSRENQVILGIIFGETIEPSKPDAEKVSSKEKHDEKDIFIIAEYSMDNELTESRIEEQEFEDQIEMTVEDQADDTTLEISQASTAKKRKFDRFDCHVCKEQLPGNNKFVQHFKDAHPDSELHYSCYLCQKLVSRYRSYTRHIESHAEKRFNCDVCDRTFSQKITLVQHLNSHSSLKAYKCDDCGLNFKQNSSLFKHRKQKHSRIILTCNECDKSFVNNETLQQHMRSKHDAEKEINCKDCLKAFASRSALMYHRSSHHSEGDEHTCKICDKNFRTFVILSRHMKKFHILD